MFKKLVSILLTSVMVLSGAIMVFAENASEGDVVVNHEDYTLCEDFDITNIPLDEYIKSIDDLEKRDLLEKYFNLPTEVVTGKSRATERSLEEIKYDDSLVEIAEEINELPIEILKEKVDAIEANVNNLISKQNALLSEELENAIADSIDKTKTNRAVDYTYTLRGALRNGSQEVVWIQSRVTWIVDNYKVTAITPYTTTGKTSYYTWYSSVSGDEYISGSYGYVEKERQFVIGNMDQPLYWVYVSARFGSSSVPSNVEEGYDYF